MIFFIDSANLDEIEKINNLGIISGVTTNPTLIAKESIVTKNSIFDHYQKICDIVNGDISTEVISTNFKENEPDFEILAQAILMIGIKKLLQVLK